MAMVFIPSLMQELSDGKDRVTVEGRTVRQIIEALESTYPGFKDRLIDQSRIKPNIAVAIDGEITPLGLIGKVSETSEVHFLPAISGGAQFGSPDNKFHPTKLSNWVIIFLLQLSF